MSFFSQESPEEFQVESKWRRGFDMYQALGLQVLYARMVGRERRNLKGSVLLASQVRLFILLIQVTVRTYFANRLKP